MADEIKDKFIPYKYIKEFYNTERLILPAVRDMIVNGIFIGGAESKYDGDTMLDTTDYPIFDLWTFIINQYRYSFFETVRGELIVVPDMMSCLPPLCNVVFPDEYVHYGRNVDLRNITTRYFDQGFTTLSGNDSSIDADNLEKIASAQQAFVAPTSDVEPLIYKVIAGECTPKKIPSSEKDVNFEAYSQIPLPEEFHYGANYKTGTGEYLSRLSEMYVKEHFGKGSDNISNKGGDQNQNKSTPDEPILEDEYNNYHKLNVLYKYFLSRLYSQKTENVRITFTPRLVCGLPILLLSRTGKHLLGLLTNLSHNLNADGIAETTATVEYQYNYDDITKRPLYFYRQGDREKLIQESKDSSDESTYVWKNAYMLSTFFRDQHIGEKMYHDILCDSIHSDDYNTYAYKGLKDKSILGILKDKSITDLKKSQQKNTDKIYFDDDRPNITGEIQVFPLGSDAAVPNFDDEMVAQRKRMNYAIEAIWNGYLSAYNKEVYKAKFDIHPLRNFDRWMSELGAKRNSNSMNFVGDGPKINWVELAKKEMEARFLIYDKKLDNKIKENENEQAKINNEKKKLEDEVKEKEKIKDPFSEVPIDNLNEDEKKKLEELKRNQQKYIEDPGYRKKIEDEKEDLNNQIKRKKEELDAIGKKENELQKKGKILEEGKLKDVQTKLTYNDYFNEYDIRNNNKFTTQGPFCLEKQEYFRDVYAKKLKENHFNDEERQFDFRILKPNDIGNQIITGMVHKKGTISKNEPPPSNITPAPDTNKKSTDKDNKDTTIKHKKSRNQIKKYVWALLAMVVTGKCNEIYIDYNKNMLLNGKLFEYTKLDMIQKTAVEGYISVMYKTNSGVLGNMISQFTSPVLNVNIDGVLYQYWELYKGKTDYTSKWVDLERKVDDAFNENDFRVAILEELWLKYNLMGIAFSETNYSSKEYRKGSKFNYIKDDNGREVNKQTYN